MAKIVLTVAWFSSLILRWIVSIQRVEGDFLSVLEQETVPGLFGPEATRQGCSGGHMRCVWQEFLQQVYADLWEASSYQSGGLACLQCGGQNLALEDVETALGYPEERYEHDTLTALREFKSTIAGAF